MTEPADLPPEEAVADPPRRRRGRWQAWLLGAVAGLLVLACASLWWVDTPSGHRFLAGRISALRPASGLRISVGRIDGSIYKHVVLRDVRVGDPDGAVASIPIAYLDWFPFAWLSNRLDIDRLHIPLARLIRKPKLRPSGKQRPLLPGFDIRLADLSIERLEVGKAITGRERVARLRGRADIRAGRAILALNGRALDGPGDLLRLSLDSRPDDNRFDLSALTIAPKDGILVALSGLKRPFEARITGKGDWTLWRGDALLALAGGRPSRLGIEQRRGHYRLDGTIEADVLGGLAHRVASPRVALVAEGTLADRILEGRASLASAAARITASGGIDLGRSSFDNLILDVGLKRGNALLKNATSEGLLLRARLIGPFETAAFDYLVTARKLSLGKTRITGLHADGNGRLNLSDTTVVPLTLKAASIAIGDRVLDEILRDVSIHGIAQIRKGILTAPLNLRTAKAQGKALLLADFGRGTYTLGFTGDIRGIEIPHFGRIDLSSKIDGASRAGSGFALKGRARAVMQRLDNGFLHGLGGGLPEVTSDLLLGSEGRLFFRGLVLTAPSLRLAAEGYRLTDGSFHFTGTGTHRSYGPLRLTLDGKIDKPKVDVLLMRPLDALGLRDVHVLAVPDAAGYGYTAEGRSTLGPFTGNGAILLPQGATAQIQVARLEVGGATASGTLLPDGSGLSGTLGVMGPVKGSIRFAMVEGLQQIGLDLGLARAVFAGPPELRVARGTVKGTILLRPGAASLDVAVDGSGVRYGRTRIGRISGTAHLVGGSGAATVTLSSQQGRAFALKADVTVAPDSYRVDLTGSIARAPLALSGPAVLTRQEDGGWRLAPTTLSYRGGTARFSGQFGGEHTQAQASLYRLPMGLFDLADSDLGLGGTASGTLTFDAPRGGAPTGKLAVNVRGLTRSGLALSSAPIDIGINALLDPTRAGMRAVIASGGQVTGRAQALLTPLGAGTLADRLTHAPLRAQIRYAGNVDTLWRLTNVELFTLSGNGTISADVAGTLADPLIRGAVAADDATLQSPVTGMALTGLATRGTFDGASLTLGQLSARTKGGGTLNGTGRFLFSSKGIGIDVSAKLDRATVLDRDDIGATVTGPIHIQSDGNGGLISGNFNVVSSRFTLGKAAAVAAIPELRVVETSRRGQEEADVPASPWRLQIHADVPSRLAVNALGMQSEWSAKLDISGTITSPVLNGDATLVRGDYDFAGKRFELREGALHFDGETPIDPSLNIRATADVNSVNATIAITGVSAKPIITFTSVPALPQDELLSRILFGTSITNLSAPEALQLASAVAAFQGGGGGLDPINAVRKAAGLSRLRILPADTTTGQKTSVAAGKDIGRSVYVELITDGQGYSATRVEYQITRWLALISSASTIGRQSANLRVTKDY